VNERRAELPERTPRGEGGDCAVDGCRRPVWRQDLCASHFKRKQRGRVVHSPIGDSIVPGGIEPGEQLGVEELVLVASNRLADADSEDDEAYEAAKRAVLRAAKGWVASLGWGKLKRDEQPPEQIGWSEAGAAQARDLFCDHIAKNLKCSRCKRRWATRVGFLLRWAVDPADREHRIVTAKPEQLASLCDRCGLGMPSVEFTFSKQRRSKSPQNSRAQAA
jgi:hypothetical protein